MAHALSISDGTNTVSLSTSNILLLSYVPTAPEMQDTAQFVNGGDGGEVLPVYSNTSETIEIMFENTSKTALQAQVGSINRLIDLAKRRQTRRNGVRVYLKFTVDGDSTTYRSEILSGRLELGEDAMRHYANIKVQARLYVNRRFYWEADSETELQLSKSNVSATTGGVTIYNHDDGGAGHDNWVQIAAAQVDGELPCPLRLTLTNNSGSSQAYRNFHIGTNAFSDPANFTHILEGEGGSGGTVTSDSSCSGGSKLVNSSWTGTNLVQLDIDGTQLQKTDGRWFRLLMRVASLTSSCYIQPQIRTGDGLVVLYTGEEVYVNTNVPIIDLGSVPLPPSAATSVSWADMKLTLSMRAVGTASIQIDYVQLTPTDSYANFTQLGYTIPNSTAITIDGIDGAIHSAGFPIYSAPLPTVWVFPNQLQRLIFLHDETTGPVSIDNTISVRAYYRPRRLTI